ncbi:MAG: hypothetical protein SV760_10055 [Halobacteria archaeon]|nr:hypothetical protein [Halobacteria archaeon]
MRVRRNTRREFLVGAAALVSLSGCMGSDGEQSGEGNGTRTDGTGGGEGGGQTGGSSDGGTGKTGPIDASFNVSVDGENETVTVTLSSIENAEYVDVLLGGNVSAKFRLKQPGDSFTVANKTGSAGRITRNGAIDLTSELGVFDKPTYTEKVEINATAYSGNMSKTVLRRTEYVGPQFITATVLHLFNDDKNQVRVTYDASMNSEYVDIRFAGDASAVGRLNQEGDELILTSDELRTRGKAEDLTEERGLSFDGAEDGDEVRLVGRAYSRGVSTVILNKTGRV